MSKTKRKSEKAESNLADATEDRAALAVLGADVAEATTVLGRIRDDIRKFIVGQNNFIDLIITTFLAREGILVKGAPGISKTSALRYLAKKTGLSFFKYQLQRDTSVEELVGGVDVIKYREQGDRVHKLGKMCDTEIGLVDEINKAPSKVIAALRQVFQERSFQETPIPLLAYACTLNPSDEEEIDPADLDRFLVAVDLRGNVENAGRNPTVDNEKNVRKLLDVTPIWAKISGDEFDPMTAIESENPAVIKDILTIVPRIQIPSYIKDCLLWIYIESQAHAKESISDRVVVKCKKLLKAHALYSGQPRVSLSDIRAVIPHVFTHRLEDAIEPNMINSIIENAVEMADLQEERNPAQVKHKREMLAVKFQNYPNDTYLFRKFASIDKKKKEIQAMTASDAALPTTFADTTETDIVWSQINQKVVDWRKERGASRNALEKPLRKMLTYTLIIPNEKLNKVPKDLRVLLMTVRDGADLTFKGWNVSGEQALVGRKGATKAQFTMPFKNTPLSRIEANFREVHTTLFEISRDAEVTLA